MKCYPPGEALLRAALQNTADAEQFIRGSDPLHVVFNGEYHGYTALHFAALNGNWALFIALVKHYPMPTYKTESSATIPSPIKIMVDKHSVNCVSKLLNQLQSQNLWPSQLKLLKEAIIEETILQNKFASLEQKPDETFMPYASEAAIVYAATYHLPLLKEFIIHHNISEDYEKALHILLGKLQQAPEKDVQENPIFQIILELFPILTRFTSRDDLISIFHSLCNVNHKVRVKLLISFLKQCSDRINIRNHLDIVYSKQVPPEARLELLIVMCKGDEWFFNHILDYRLSNHIKCYDDLYEVSLQLDAIKVSPTAWYTAIYKGNFVLLEFLLKLNIDHPLHIKSTNGYNDTFYPSPIMACIILQYYNSDSYCLKKEIRIIEDALLLFFKYPIDKKPTAKESYQQAISMLVQHLDISHEGNNGQKIILGLIKLGITIAKSDFDVLVKHNSSYAFEVFKNLPVDTQKQYISCFYNSLLYLSAIEYMSQQNSNTTLLELLGDKENPQMILKILPFWSDLPSNDFKKYLLDHLIHVIPPLERDKVNMLYALECAEEKPWLTNTFLHTLLSNEQLFPVIFGHIAIQDMLRKINLLGNDAKISKENAEQLLRRLPDLRYVSNLNYLERQFIRVLPTFQTEENRPLSKLQEIAVKKICEHMATCKNHSDKEVKNRAFSDLIFIITYRSPFNSADELRELIEVWRRSISSQLGKSNAQVIAGTLKEARLFSESDRSDLDFLTTLPSEIFKSESECQLGVNESSPLLEEPRLSHQNLSQ